MAQNAILEAVATTSNLGRKRSLVTTGACIAHAWMWVSLCTINNVQCVWMRLYICQRGKSHFAVENSYWKARHGTYDELEISSFPVCNRNQTL